MSVSLKKRFRGVMKLAVGLKVRLVLLVVVMMLFIVAALLVGTLVPWRLTHDAAIDTVRSTVQTLLEAETSKVSDSIISLLQPSHYLAARDYDDFISLHYVNLSDSRAVLTKLIRDALQFFPDWSLRYHCLGVDGPGAADQMECVAFDQTSKRLWIQELRFMNSTNSTHQVQWECDQTTLWNSSWPNEPWEDLGEYGIEQWWDDRVRSLTVDETFWSHLYVEYTNAEQQELIRSFYHTLHDSSDGHFVGVVTLDFLLTQFSEYLEANVAKTSKGIIVDRDTHEVYATSVANLSYTKLDATGYPSTIVFTEIDDPMLAALAAEITRQQLVLSKQSQSFQLDVGSDHVHVFTESVDDGFRFNATLILEVPDDDFISPFLDKSQSAGTAGITIVVVVPVVMMVVVLTLVLLLVRTTYQIKEVQPVDEGELSTGMDLAISTLKKLKAEASKNKATVAALDSVLNVLCSGGASAQLFRPDIEVAAKEGKIEEDQLIYLRGEMAVTTHHLNNNHLAPPQPRRQQQGQQQHIEDSMDVMPGSMPTMEMSVMSDNDLLSQSSTVNQTPPLINGLESWDFNVLSLCCCSTAEAPLMEVAMQSLQDQGILQDFHLDKAQMRGFLTAVESKYHPENPYHTSLHAADVTQAMHVLITNGGGQLLQFNGLEKFAMLLATVIHDVDHPGTNNTFQIMTESPLAVTHNDSAVLENHHMATGWKLIKEFGILSQFDANEVREIRKLIIAMVLATDMSQHFQILSEFKAGVQSGTIKSTIQQQQQQPQQQQSPQQTETKPEIRLLVMKMMIKVADTSNPARPETVMRTWAQKVFEEFLLQGDLEKSLGLPLTQHMDRMTSKLPRLQTNFLQFVVIPMFKVFNEFCPIPELMRNLEKNFQCWMDEDESRQGSRGSNGSSRPMTMSLGGASPVSPTINTSRAKEASLIHLIPVSSNNSNPKV